MLLNFMFGKQSDSHFIFLGQVYSIFIFYNVLFQHNRLIYKIEQRVFLCDH